MFILRQIKGIDMRVKANKQSSMISVEIGHKESSGIPHRNTQLLPQCKAIELYRIYSEETNENCMLLSFNWVTENPKTGAIGIEHYTLPLTGIGLPKPVMGVFFLTRNQKTIIVNFNNLKEGTTVECLGRNVPADLTLMYKILKW